MADKKIGCLLIHGFGGNIHEVSPLADFLSLNGYSTVCPKLKGHTGRRRDLKGVSFNDWIKSAEDGLLELKAKSSRIIIIGFSMGGLIALNLSMMHKVDGVITLNMPIYYWDFKRIFLNILEDFKEGNFKNLKRYVKSSADKPLSSLINFKVLLRKTKDKINEVSCPIFICQSLKDDTVQVRSAEYIYQNVKSLSKEVKYYKNSGHLISYSPAFPEASEDILNFIRQIEKDLDF